MVTANKTIDVRDIIARIEELEVWQFSDTAAEEQELATLQSLMDKMKGRGSDHLWRGDWYPIVLIRDSYFIEAMKETEIRDLGLPDYLVIDWEATAENLRSDYSSIKFDGATYWYDWTLVC